MRNLVKNFTEIEMYDIIIFNLTSLFVYFFIEWQHINKPLLAGSEPLPGISDKIMFIEMFPDASNSNRFEYSFPTTGVRLILVG